MKFNIFIIYTIYLIIVIIGCYPPSSSKNSSNNSSTKPADDFSFEDIQTAIDAAEDGDTVNIPAGKSTWTKRIEIKKEITLTGAGIDKTIITRINGGEAFYINVNDKPVRISGITINGNNESNGINSFNSKDFRIDNNKFENCITGIIIWNYSYGVIDHNTFCNIIMEGVKIYGDDSTAWDRESTYLAIYGDNLGHNEFVFIEDNNFIYNENGQTDYLAHAVASNHGARYVFRYNNIHALYIKNKLHLPSAIDVHGNFSYGRGTVAFEIYNNVIYSEHSYRGINIRGGTGVIFNNIFTGDFTYPIHLTNYRSWDTPKNENPGECPIGDYNPFYCEDDYPCIDQINNLYIWGNTYNGNIVQAEVDDRGYNTVHIQEDRDYFHEVRPGYTPYTYPHPLTK